MKQKTLNKKIPTIIAVVLLIILVSIEAYFLSRPFLANFKNEILKLPQQFLAQEAPSTEPIPTPIQNTKVTLLNPEKENETLNTLKPEFFGLAKANQILTIKLKSTTTYSATTTVDNNGSWRFTPPLNLTPGKFQIEISFSNEQNKLETLSRNFVITDPKNNSLPAFTASSSAQASSSAKPSLIPSASPLISTTPKATFSASISPSLSPTFSPVPEIEVAETMPSAGTVTPTLILGISGTVLLILGFLL